MSFRIALGFLTVLPFVVDLAIPRGNYLELRRWSIEKVRLVSEDEDFDADFDDTLHGDEQLAARSR